MEWDQLRVKVRSVSIEDEVGDFRVDPFDAVGVNVGE